MIKYCSYCNESFEALRKDKCFCSHSCRQIAFVKRKEDQENILLPSHQNVNSKRQLIDTSIDGSPLEKSIKHIELTDEIDVTISKEAKKENEIALTSKEYEKIHCSWLYFFHFDIGVRGYEEELVKLLTTYGAKSLQVKRISEYYLCIVRSLIYLNDQRKVLWEDLTEITNALTFLCNMEDFKSLPERYPYITEILKLRDKLKVLCLSTKGEEEIALYFDLNTKYQLLIHQYELSVFPKITFNQLISKLYI